MSKKSSKFAPQIGKHKKITNMSKALLMILDGWGIGNKSKADVISVTPTPHWDALLAKYPHSQL